MPHRSDEELFAAFQRERDCGALGVLFRRRADELLRIAVFLSPRPTDAEDVVQATFLSAIARAETFRPGLRVMSWLCGILTNHARMLRRAERRGQPPAQDQVADDPADAALRSELRQALAAGIHGLPEPYRSVLALHLENGLDSTEISQRLARPAATVRKQMERALDRLRAALPFGLAAAFVASLDAQALADHAADSARFVEPEPMPDHDLVASGGAWARLLPWSCAVVLALAAAFAPWSFGSDATPVVPTTAVTDASIPTSPADPGLRIAAAVLAANTAERRRADHLADLAVTAMRHDGTPADGVELILVGDVGKALPERILSGQAHSARTDHAGAAMFFSLAPGDYDITWPGAISKRRLELTAGTQTATIELPPPIEFAGTVVDEHSRPVAGADIVVSESSLRGDLGTIVARSHADGSFQATAMLGNGRVFALGHGHRSSIGARLEPVRTLRLTLPAAQREVVVTVKDERDRACRGAYVAIVPRSTALSLLPPQHGRTDGDGRCHFHDPGAGEASVVASVDGHAPTSADLPPQATELVLTAVVGGTLRGRVTDATGTGLGNLSVRLAVADQRSNEPVAPLLARATRSANDGSFAFAHVPLGLVQVQVHGELAEAPGLLPFPWLLASADVEVDGTEPAAINLVATRGPRLRGRVLDADGRPAANHNVLAVPTLGTALHRTFRTRGTATAADGTFSIDGLAADETYDLGVYPPGGPRGRDANFPFAFGRGAPGQESVTLNLPARTPRAALHVRVLGPDGRPHGNATLELRHVLLQSPTTRPSGPDGTAKFAPLAAGEYWLVVMAPGLGTTTLPVTIADDQVDLDLGPVTLQPPARLVVQVADARGRVRSGVRVIAAHTLGDKSVVATTGDDGRAPLPVLPPGRTRLVVQGPGVVPLVLEQDLQAGPQLVDVTVRDAVTVPLQFRFALADNPFVVNGPLHVRIERSDGEFVTEENVGAVSARGLFECPLGLSPGRYRVVARALWNGVAKAEFEVPSSGTLPELQFALRR
jgi:RNA polymerase sigma-70 factor (ECF subfamily)